MYLKTLHLKQFRNYPDQTVAFNAPKTILVGNNAQGKSNLLESVELLSTLKSHRVNRDRDLILEGESMGQIHGTLERQTGIIDLGLILRHQGRRTVTLNGEVMRRHLDFLSLLNVVQFSCLDLELVRGGPEQRRSWLDRLLIQLEPIYAHILQQYNQVLRQRNAFLKQVKHPLRDADQGREKWGEKILNPQHPLTLTTPEVLHTPPSISQSELALWDAQLATIGVRVIRRRSRVLERLVPLAQAWHQSISGSTEMLEVNYAPNIAAASGIASQDNPEQMWQEFLEKIQQKTVAEFRQGTSLVGPHRDDVMFTINKTPARQYGSQGQQRTLVLALKLAELQLIEEVIGEAPLLLLDDVLAELDLSRQNQLLEAITDHFQTLITTTHLGSFERTWLQDTQILSVQGGHISIF